MTYHANYTNATASGVLDMRAAYAIERYALYILNGGSQDATLITWAKKYLTVEDVYALATKMRFAIRSDANFATANTDDDAGDTALQPIVETLINNMFKNI